MPEGVDRYYRFGEAYCLHLQGWSSSAGKCRVLGLRMEKMAINMDSATNILNTQSWATDNGLSSCVGIVWSNVLRNVKQGLEIWTLKCGCEDNIKIDLKEIGYLFILVVYLTALSVTQAM
jgi:hypothetical protein